MDSVVVTMRIMPVSPDVDLSALETLAKKEIIKFTGIHETKTKFNPIAFGLKALEITFISPENKGSTEVIEKAIAGFDGVNSVEVTDVRRAIG